MWSVPVQERAVALWRQVDPELGDRIAQGIGILSRETVAAGGE